MYRTRCFLTAVVILCSLPAVHGQQKPPTAVVEPSSSTSTSVAATVNGQATDESLLKVFNAEREMFDGTLVRARHILLTPAANDPKAAENAETQLLKFKKEIEEKVAKEMAKLPAETDKQAREGARRKFSDEALSDYAPKNPTCPAKEQGGDVAWFPPGGQMVEACAR